MKHEIKVILYQKSSVMVHKTISKTCVLENLELIIVVFASAEVFLSSGPTFQFDCMFCVR